MALSGKINADFASFFSACQQAQTELKGFDVETKNVEKSLNRMVDDFSGRKIQTEAALMVEAIERIGGVSKLTEAELAKVGRTAAEATAKMRATGEDIPPGLQKLADGAKGAATSIDGMGQALSTASGILGAFGIGLSLDSLVSFGKAVLDDADALMAMSAKTGLTTDALQRFQTVGNASGTTIEEMSAAIVQLENRIAGGDQSAAGAIERLGLNFADFKRLAPEDQFIELADAIKQVKDPSQQVSLAMDTMGQAGVKALPAIKEGFDGVKNAAVGQSSIVIKALDDLGDTFGGVGQKAKDAAGNIIAAFFIAGTLSETQRIMDDLAASIARAGVAAAAAVPSMGALVPPGLPADLAAIEAGFDRDAKIINEQMSPAAIAFRKAMEDLSLAGIGWVTVLDTIDGNVVEAIKYYLDAGISQRALADAYGLTATQIGAVDAARKNEIAGLDLENTFKARRLELAKIELTATNDAVLAKLKAQQADQAFLDTELKVALAQDAANAKVKEVPKAMDDSAAATDRASKAAGVYMNQLHMLVSDPKLAAFFGGNATANTLYSGGQGGFTPEEAASIAAGIFINKAGVGNVSNLGANYRAAGGPVSAGSPYVVGERGPELFVPGTNGAIVPSGGGGNTINITVSQPLGTPEAIARAVGEALTTRSRAIGQRL